MVSSFQEFRYRLVALVDGLLRLFEEDPDLSPFAFTGQHIFLNDYLEMRPYLHEAIGMIKSGERQEKKIYTKEMC